MPVPNALGPCKARESIISIYGRQCATMSKNDDDKDDISVRCRSGLSDLDLDLCNRRKEEAGTYSLANLLEIRLSFQHYRCETFANCLRTSTHPRSHLINTFSSSRQHCGGGYYPTSSSTHHNLASLSSHSPQPPKEEATRSHRLIQSLPSSPPNELSLGQSSGDHHYCRDTTKLLPGRAKATTSRTDFHVLLSKLTRFRRRHLPASVSSNRPKRVGLFLKNRQKSSDREPILGASFSSAGSSSISSRGASSSTAVDENRGCISDAAKVKSTRLLSVKHVHKQTQRCAPFGDAGADYSSCSLVSGEQTTASTGPCSPPSFEISSGLSANPVNNSSPDCSSSSRTASHQREAVCIGHIPPNTQVHSSSLSFSNISSSYSSLLKDASTLHQNSSTSAPSGTSGRPSSSPVKHSQLDFRSISEYSFIHAPTISHFLKSDVCSLPICMDDPMSSKMLDPSKAHFGESQSSRRMPSYVSISRAISGYSNYNQYSSDLRRDNSLLNSLLPSRGSSRANGEHHHHSAHRRLLVDDQVDNFCSLPYEPTQEKITDPSKSFLQKKIESLYGQTFAEDWKKTRGRSSSSKSNSPTEKTRSPSCPPSRINRDGAASASSTTQISVHPQTINSLHSSREDLCLKELTSVSDVIDEKRNLSTGEIASSVECNATQDANWFLRELNECKIDIQEHVDRYESVLTSTEDTIPEESVGKVRATIGKANLLLNKKLNQFNQLCLDSIAQSEDQQFKINPDDLQGFWDMVTIQVEEVKGAFDDLDVLRQNNWTAVDEETSEQFKASSRKPSSSTTKHNSNSPRSVSKLVSPMNSPKSSKTASPNGLEREAERKLRLMEIKRKGKMKARERSTDEEITIFMSTTDNDLDK